MTKSRKLLFLTSFILAALLGYLVSRATKQLTTTAPTDGRPTPRTYIGPDRKPLPAPHTPPATSNAISADWNTQLRQSFKRQAPSLKDVTVEVEKSFVLMVGTNALNVESVKVILTNQQGEESSFRALVDSQTGKVIETWDRSISDPVNPRDGFRLKLDPRYP